MKQSNDDYKVVPFSNRKTVREIHHEIRAAQMEDVPKAWESFKAFQFLPTFLFRFPWWMQRYPQVQKKFLGPVGITAVGMFGKGSGWGISTAPIHSLFLTLGGIAEKPGVVDGHIAIREYLCMTLSFDHSIVDGAPAARFTQRLKDLIESGYGLDDFTVVSEQAIAPGTSKKSENSPIERRTYEHTSRLRFTIRKHRTHSPGHR